MSYKWEALAGDLTEEREKLMTELSLQRLAYADLTEERDRLLKENERLRKALALVAKLNPDFAGIGAGMIRTIVSEAKSALKE